MSAPVTLNGTLPPMHTPAMLQRSVEPSGQSSGPSSRQSSGPSPSRPPRGSLGHDLAEDWRHLVRRSRPADLDAVLHAAGYRPYSCTHPTSTVVIDAGSDASDRTLAALVTDAATDPLAARIVLQRILPGLIAIARRRSHQRVDLTSRMYQDLLANAWIVIRCFPIHRRPDRVAANLLLDVEYQTFVREARRRQVRTSPRHGAAWEDIGTADLNGSSSSTTHPFDELIEVLREARDAGVQQQSLRFAAALASGRTLADLAADDRRSERAERYRRARVAAELRSLVVDTGEDASPA